MLPAHAHDLDRFLDATNPARVPQFDPDRDLIPVVLDGWAPPVGQLTQVVDRAAAAGFALVDGGQPATDRDLLDLAYLLALDDPLASPASGPIGTAFEDGAGSVGSIRYEDDDATGRVWYADTTAPRAGDVRTSLLLCTRSTSGAAGIVLFNATAALVEVARRDPSAAVALMRSASAGQADLVAASTSPSKLDAAGPPFAITGGHLLAPGPPGGAVRWAATDPAAARRGLALLNELAITGSGYRLDVPLAAGQGIVLASARIWYSPTAIADIAGPLMVLHGLFGLDLLIAGR